ncbi:hypothetical protein A5692_03305 [Mycobacterium sp. E342]|nr:hypothetical protein A5692_03305 [Mycobacterium sp. E342]
MHTWCAIIRPGRRLNRWFKRLTGRHCHRSTASGRFDFRQITGGPFEVLGHVTAGFGDIGQHAARSRCAFPTSTPRSATRSLRLFLCAKCGGSRTVGRRTRLTEARCEQGGAVECDFAGAQSRPSRTPILGMHKAFQLLQPRFRKFAGIDRSIEKTFFPGVFHHARPGGGRTLRIGDDPLRAQVDEAQSDADRTFEDTLMGVDPGVG